MKLEEKNLIVKRSYKEVYKCEEGIVKVFAKEHPKSDVLNEALNTARVEEAGLDIPSVKEVTQIDGKWALVIEYKDGKTMEEMMKVDPTNLEKYMNDFVDLQLSVRSTVFPCANSLPAPLRRQRCKSWRILWTKWPRRMTRSGCQSWLMRIIRN